MNTKLVKSKLLLRDGDACHICDRKMLDVPQEPGKAVHPRTMTIDHLVPKADQGTNELRNLKLACYECNNRRGQGPIPPKPKSTVVDLAFRIGLYCAKITWKPQQNHAFNVSLEKEAA